MVWCINSVANEKDGWMGSAYWLNQYLTQGEEKSIIDNAMNGDIQRFIPGRSQGQLLNRACSDIII